jgi:hypothetical protein
MLFLIFYFITFAALRFKYTSVYLTVNITLNIFIYLIEKVTKIQIKDIDFKRFYT